VRPFSVSTDEIVLLPAAPPVRIRVSSQTRIALWMDGVRVSGPAVTFLTWNSEMSDAEGSWWAKNLPPQPLRVLAWQRTPAQDIASGLRDANATIIPYPWPPDVALDPID
jgi:hypothetical protein